MNETWTLAKACQIKKCALHLHRGMNRQEAKRILTVTLPCLVILPYNETVNEDIDTLSEEIMERFEGVSGIVHCIVLETSNTDL